MTRLTTPARGLLERARPVTIGRSTAADVGGVGMACPGCQSGNTERLSHYWESLPAESPLKARCAPPFVTQVQLLAVVAIVAVGIWIAWTGEPLWGLGISVGGLLWGAMMTMGAIASQARKDVWAATQLCLSCTKRWQP